VLGVAKAGAVKLVAGWVARVVSEGKVDDDNDAATFWVQLGLGRMVALRYRGSI
jgi:hypothetical protein